MNTDIALHDAQALVERWALEFGHGSPVPDALRITLTAAVKDRMAAEIAALLEEHCVRGWTR